MESPLLSPTTISDVSSFLSDSDWEDVHRPDGSDNEPGGVVDNSATDSDADSLIGDNVYELPARAGFLSSGDEHSADERGYEAEDDGASDASVPPDVRSVAPDDSLAEDDARVVDALSASLAGTLQVMSPPIVSTPRALENSAADMDTLAPPALAFTFTFPDPITTSQSLHAGQGDTSEIPKAEDTSVSTNVPDVSEVKTVASIDDFTSSFPPSSREASAFSILSLPNSESKSVDQVSNDAAEPIPSLPSAVSNGELMTDASVDTKPAMADHVQAKQHVVTARTFWKRHRAAVSLAVLAIGMSYLSLSMQPAPNMAATNAAGHDITPSTSASQVADTATFATHTTSSLLAPSTTAPPPTISSSTTAGSLSSISLKNLALSVFSVDKNTAVSVHATAARQEPVIERTTTKRLHQAKAELSAPPTNKATEVPQQPLTIDPPARSSVAQDGPAAEAEATSVVRTAPETGLVKRVGAGLSPLWAALSKDGRELLDALDELLTRIARTLDVIRAQVASTPRGRGQSTAHKIARVGVAGVRTLCRWHKAASRRIGRDHEKIKSAYTAASQYATECVEAAQQRQHERAEASRRSRREREEHDEKRRQQREEQEQERRAQREEQEFVHEKRREQHDRRQRDRKERKHWRDRDREEGQERRRERSWDWHGEGDYHKIIRDAEKLARKELERAERLTKRAMRHAEGERKRRCRQRECGMVNEFFEGMLDHIF